MDLAEALIMCLTDFVEEEWGENERWLSAWVGNTLMMKCFWELSACFIIVVIMLRSLEPTHYIMAASKGNPFWVVLMEKNMFSLHYKTNQLVSWLISQSVNPSVGLAAKWSLLPLIWNMHYGCCVSSDALSGEKHYVLIMTQSISPIIIVHPSISIWCWSFEIMSMFACTECFQFSSLLQWY